MRKQDRIIIWPTYFDSTKTRKNGRRIPKNLSVPSPRILEVKDAAEKLGMECELVEGAGYSKTPLLKAGLLLVKKSEAKEKTIKRIAKQLVKTRSIIVKKD